MKFKNLSKVKLTESVDWDYYNRFDPIIKKYLPDSGEGETIASQIVTAVNKLIYKWYNDGDVFDNTSSNGLDGWVNDLSTYANWLYNYADGTTEILDKVFNADKHKYENLLKELADLTLTEEYLSNYETKAAVDSIYEADGPYEFIDRSEEDDDDDYSYWDDEDDEDLDEALDDKLNRCVICKKPYVGHGNNAAPLAKGRCCDNCNMKVIKARLKNLTEDANDINKYILEIGYANNDGTWDKTKKILKGTRDKVEARFNSELEKLIWETANNNSLSKEEIDEYIEELEANTPYEAHNHIYYSEDPDGEWMILVDEVPEDEEELTEDTIKQNGKWVNKGEEGTHGKFRTKKEADAQRKAMFAQGFKEDLSTNQDVKSLFKTTTDFTDDFLEVIEEGNYTESVFGDAKAAWDIDQFGIIILNKDGTVMYPFTYDKYCDINYSLAEYLDNIGEDPEALDEYVDELASITGLSKDVIRGESDLDESCKKLNLDEALGLKEYWDDEEDYDYLDWYENVDGHPLQDLYMQACDELNVWPEPSTQGRFGAVYFYENETDRTLYKVEFEDEIDFMTDLAYENSRGINRIGLKRKRSIVDRIKDFISSHPYKDEEDDEDFVDESLLSEALSIEDAKRKIDQFPYQITIKAEAEDEFKDFLLSKNISFIIDDHLTADGKRGKNSTFHLKYPKHKNLTEDLIEYEIYRAVDNDPDNIQLVDKVSNMVTAFDRMMDIATEYGEDTFVKEPNKEDLLDQNEFADKVFEYGRYLIRKEKVAPLDKLELSELSSIETLLDPLGYSFEDILNESISEDISHLIFDKRYGNKRIAELDVASLNDIDHYFKLIKTVKEAEKFNYHSDYWGYDEDYQEQNVDLITSLSPYINKLVTIEYDDGAIQGKLLGIAIDKEYNSISHTKVILDSIKDLDESLKLEEFYDEDDDYEDEESDRYALYLYKVLDIPSMADYVDETPRGLAEKLLNEETRSSTLEKLTDNLISLGFEWDWDEFSDIDEAVAYAENGKLDKTNPVIMYEIKNISDEYSHEDFNFFKDILAEYMQENPNAFNEDKDIDLKEGVFKTIDAIRVELKDLLAQKEETLSNMDARSSSMDDEDRKDYREVEEDIKKINEILNDISENKNLDTIESRFDKLTSDKSFQENTSSKSSEIIDELSAYLYKNGMHYEIYEDNNHIVVRIEDGDWKHDHIALDLAVANFFDRHPKYKGQVIDVEAEDSDSDTYTGNHIIEYYPYELGYRVDEALDESASEYYHYSDIEYDDGDIIDKTRKLSTEVVNAYTNKIEMNPEKLVYMLDHQDEDYANTYKYCYRVSAPKAKKVKMDFSPMMCQDYLDRINKKFSSEKIAEVFADWYTGKEQSIHELSVLGLEPSDKEEFIADTDVKVIKKCEK